MPFTNVTSRALLGSIFVAVTNPGANSCTASKRRSLAQTSSAERADVNSFLTVAMSIFSHGTRNGRTRLAVSGPRHFGVNLLDSVGR